MSNHGFRSFLRATILIAAAAVLLARPSAAALKTADEGGALIIENQASGLRLEINKSSGLYHVTKDGKLFIGDGLVAVRTGDKMLLNASPGGAPSGEMKLASVSTATGADSTGSYNSATLKWEAGSLMFDTEFRVYENRPAVKFLQKFPGGYKADKLAAFGDTGLNFPVFSPDDSGDGMNIFSYSYQIWPQAQFGRNVKYALSNYENGFIATPLFVFDKTGWTGVLSPFSDFLVRFVRVIDLSDHGFSRGAAVGLDGELQKLDPGHVTESILVFSNTGVVDSMNSLGGALLTESGKKPIGKYDTFFIKYLGYWTDNGAFYYYRTEPDKNYADTLLAVGEYLKKEKIPARHVQLDSWWYYKSKVDNGVYRWEPRTDMFPEGLMEFQKKLGIPLTFHNRYFAIDTVYKDRMPFVGNDGAVTGTEKDGNAYGDGPSVKDGIQPLTREVFDVWGESVKQWGGVMYEQDWLGTQIFRVNALRRDPALAGNWMKNMNAAMADRGLDIQYCMPTILFYFESTRHQAVTNIRSSNDYYVRFHGRSVNLWWEHYYTSPLIAAMGLWPYKDVFITNPPDKTFDDPLRARQYVTSGDPNNKYDQHAHLFEPYYRQEALLSILSAGPVGIGDRIGDINKPLVMLMADEEGALVKPDRSLAPVERMFFTNPMAQKETLVGYTSSEVSGKSWYYVLGIHVNELLINSKIKFTLTNSDLPLSGEYVIYDFYGGKAVRPGREFSLARSLGQTEFVYAVLAPLSAEGRALIGDKGKFVTASSARIKSWSDGPGSMDIELNGPAGSPTRLLIYSEKAPSKIAAAFGSRAIAKKSADDDKEGWRAAGDNLYEIVLPGGAGEKVKIAF